MGPQQYFGLGPIEYFVTLRIFVFQLDFRFKSLSWTRSSFVFSTFILFITVTYFLPSRHCCAAQCSPSENAKHETIHSCILVSCNFAKMNAIMCFYAAWWPLQHEIIPCNLWRQYLNIGPREGFWAPPPVFERRGDRRPRTQDTIRRTYLKWVDPTLWRQIQVLAVHRPQRTMWPSVTSFNIITNTWCACYILNTVALRESTEK